MAKESAPPLVVETTPTDQRVGHNIRAIRTSRGMSLKTLSDRLSELGSPLSLSALSKLETQRRFATVGEVTAIALALGTTVNRLVVTGDADEEVIRLTSNLPATAEVAWLWAAGEERFDPFEERASVPEADVLAWRRENQPHRGHAPLSLAAAGLHGAHLNDFKDAFRALRFAGLSIDQMVEFAESEVQLVVDRGPRPAWADDLPKEISVAKRPRSNG